MIVVGVAFNWLVAFVCRGFERTYQISTLMPIANDIPLVGVT
jgi:hypothetical protein